MSWCKILLTAFANTLGSKYSQTIRLSRCHLPFTISLSSPSTRRMCSSFLDFTIFGFAKWFTHGPANPTILWRSDLVCFGLLWFALVVPPLPRLLWVSRGPGSSPVLGGPGWSLRIGGTQAPALCLNQLLVTQQWGVATHHRRRLTHLWERTESGGECGRPILAPTRSFTPGRLLWSQHFLLPHWTEKSHWKTLTLRKTETLYSSLMNANRKTLYLVAGKNSLSYNWEK